MLLPEENANRRTENGYTIQGSRDAESHQGPQQGSGGLAEVWQGETLNNSAGGSERGSSSYESGHVESDGSRCNGERDAPGQSCMYIPPGDHCSEAYRLATFAMFPKDIPVKTTELAMMGFYYTGYRDRVRCFSCGGCVENFVLGDSAFDHRWHRSECLMVIGQETSNVPTHMSQLRIMFMQFTGRQGPQLSANNFSRPSIPGEAMDVTEVAADLTRVQIQEVNPELILASIVNAQHEDTLRSLNLKKEEHRRKTFAKWPSYPCPNLPAELARDGFFYLGNLDRVQCFSCSGVLRNWAPGDVIREQHLRHFHHCRFANDMDTRNIPMTSQQRYLAEEEDRVRAASRIPNENTREPPNPSPEEQRHLASYFPCTNALNPHMESLQRRIETFERWPQNRTRATPEQMAAAGLFHLGDSDKTKCYYCNGGLQNWEYNDEPWTEHAKWFPGCEFVIRRKGADFVKMITDTHPNLNRPTIRNAVSYQNFPSSIPSSTMTQRSPNEITGAVGGPPNIKVKDGLQGKMDVGVETKRPRTSSPLVPPDPTLITNLREMEQTLMCRVCKANQAEAIVLPCAHLCACQDCVKTMKRCAVCGHKVHDSMKVFRA